MTVWLTVYYLAFPLGAAGVVVGLRGLRARTLDDHPICRRCKYDLFGLPDDRRQCPECGAELTEAGAVTIGHRAPRPRAMITGFVLFWLALGVGRLADWRYELIVSRPTRLYDAVTNGDLAEVDRLLRKDPSLAHGWGSDGAWPPDTPLQTAIAFAANPKVVQRILDEAPDLDRPSDHGKTALHVAAEYRRLAYAEQLLDLGADVDPVTDDGVTPLHWAATQDRTGGLVRLLLRYGAALDHPVVVAEPQQAKTALSLAVERGNEAAATPLPPLVGGELDRGKTALHLAAERGNKAALTALLDAGALVDARDALGRTPLHLACRWPDHVELVRRLIEAGADIHARDAHGQTPLHWAAGGQNHEALALLIELGADLTARDAVDMTVLDAAFQWGFHPDAGPKILSRLREAGHPPTALYAAATGYVAALERLARDDPQRLDQPHTSSGVRPLHVAVVAGQQRVVEWLLDQGVEVDALTGVTEWGPPGQSPLLMASIYNHADIAILLIERGADVNREDRHGYRPAHVVIQWDRDPKLLAALLAHGTDATLTSQNVTAVQLVLDSKSKHRDLYLQALHNAGYAQAASSTVPPPEPERTGVRSGP